ncbi:GNAT family N-acetyltransferase [Leisingera sp.]|uniref:GNAT family N-acetyltransferase n=1 Tax=Leisingera sp. TaxID=1879318 RepID=UPI002B26AFF0|nr:GNAT family N-acetyltransferase [Leisingera sp.]
MDHFPKILDHKDFRLRPLEEGDLPEITRQLGDCRIAPWLAAAAQPFGRAEAEALLAHSRHPGEHLRVMVREGSLAGCLCLGAALWYWLEPSYWGRGLMHRALKTTITARFSGPAPPLVATCHVDNTTSRALLARLGFAPSPTPRRMFFQSSQRAEPCQDYLMAPEQWHLLHPPRIVLGRSTLRPAVQRDAATLARMLPCAETGPWPGAEALPAFIENHRFRGQARGLFVLEDSNRRSIGMALLLRNGPVLRFLSEEDDTRHRGSVETALARGLFPAVQSQT